MIAVPSSPARCCSPGSDLLLVTCFCLAHLGFNPSRYFLPFPLPSLAPLPLGASLGARLSLLWVDLLYVQTELPLCGIGFCRTLTISRNLWSVSNLEKMASFPVPFGLNPKSPHKHCGQASATSHQGLNQSSEIKTSPVALCV
jgi:hypothetical protein